MRSTFTVHIDQENARVEGDILLDHNVATIRICKNSQELIVFGGVTELELLGRKCIEIADELRAATAAKDEVAA
tara:strand:- start:185 stop:406 length:222 start_codon:yes stop_codon:yes gene_type:complete